MINVDDNFKIDIRTHGRQFDVKLKANNNDISSDNLNYIKPSFNTSLFKTVMHQIEIDSKIYMPNKTKITGKIGVKVNEKNYNYIDLNTYYVKSCERQEDTNSYRILAYTKMQEAMVDSKLEFTEKLTVRNYLLAVCQKLNWNTDNIPETFINSDKLVDSTLHIGIGYTYRDILDEIATITCSFLLFKGNNLYLIYPTETNQNIDESYLDEDNITIGEKYIINSLVFSRAEESDNIYRKDDTSIATNGLHEYRISDNQLLSTNDRADYIDAMFNYLKTLSFYIFDVQSKGILFLEVCDIFNFVLNDVTYKTILLNNEIELDDGLVEKLYTDEPAETETEYKYASDTDKKINQTNLKVDKQNQKIEGLITQIGDRSEKTTSITADIDGLSSKVSAIADLTKEIIGNKNVILNECAKGELFELRVYGNNTVFNYQVLNDDLVLNDNLILGKDKSILVITNADNNSVEYDLKVPGVLRKNENIRDEFVIQNGVAKIIKRINDDGTVKDTEEEEILGELKILLEEGTNTVEIKDFNAEIKVKWVIKSDFTDVFTTKVEMSSSIEQTSEKIMTEVNKKVDEDELGTKIEQNSEAVKLAWNQISEFIQMMIINNKASFGILDENHKLLMVLDKTGQHFYDNNTIFGNMGVQKVEDNKYISFAVPTEYGQNTSDGMAWGMITQSDEKFYPILFIRDFKMASKSAGDFSGQLVLTACDLVLSGNNTGIISGNIKIVGGLSGEINFINTEDESILLQIIPKNEYDSNSPKINLLNSIHFFENALGSHSFRIGEQKYVLQTDEGDFHVAGGTILLGTNSSKATISMYPSSMVQIHGADLDVDGNVYANNISSDRRIKDSIKDSTIKALDIIKQIKHKQFNKKDDEKHYNIGYIAQDIEKIDPNFVIKRPADPKRKIEERYYINELPIIATLSKAIQEQQEQIEELKKQIKKLKGENDGKD